MLEPENDLLERSQSLQARLDEADETLRALSNGEVDAFVASGPHGDWVYTLKGSDDAYRIMVQNMTEGAVTLTLDGTILFSNEQFALLLGVPLERVIGYSMRDFLAAGDVAKLSAIIASSTPTKSEVRLKNASISAVFTQISANRLVLDGIECVCLIVTDLSQMRDSEERYRLLVENIEDYAILMLDPEGLVSSWTSAAERIKGYTAPEVVGKSFGCFYTKDDVARGHPQEVLQAARLKGHFEEEGWRVRKDGSVFWANVMITTLYDASGGIRGFSKMTRDISERRRIEQELRESEEQFRMLLECAPDAIVIVDDDGQLALMNTQAEKLFGYGRDELVGHPVETLLLPEGGNGIPLWHSDFGQSTGFRQMRTGVGFRKDGASFPAEISLSAIRTQRAAWVAAAIRDDTERMEAERRLVAERRRAELANRTKTDFLAAMSHEIRTPMNAILGMADLLWETELSQTQKDYVGRFRRAGTNLMTLINDILDLSKIESGRFELECIDFSLSDLVGRTMELMSPRAREKGIEITVRIDAGSPVMLVGDPSRLQQVLNNVIGNAITFTEAGTVTVTVKCHGDNQPGHLEFSVSDTGIGIPLGKLSEIFEDFTQAESSTTRRFGGTGLGLGICRRLVERMGGSLSVQSTFGEGSTFTFDVILSLSGQMVGLQKTEVIDFTGRRVLIVDRNPTTRMILSQTCTGWGIVTVEAASVETGCDLLRNAKGSQNAFSLVLLDDFLSGSSGFDVLKQLLEINADLPVVLISSYNHAGDMTKAKALGAAAYVVKPVRTADLLASMSAALRENEQKHGSRFSPPLQPADRSLIKEHALRILVADDSDDNCFLVAAYLRNLPYELTFAKNGREALEMFASRAFDLILMDIQMPIMDGLAATAAIRALEGERSTKPIPVLALSANARPEDIELSVSAGCNTHLSKPISKEKLIATIESFSCFLPTSGATLDTIDWAIDIPDGFEQHSRDYLAARRMEISRMKDLAPGQNLTQLRVFGHNMKGTAVSFGFPELTRLGEAIEEAAKTSQMGQLAEHLLKAKEFIEFASETLSKRF